MRPIVLSIYRIQSWSHALHLAAGLGIKLTGHTIHIYNNRSTLHTKYNFLINLLWCILTAKQTQLKCFKNSWLQSHNLFESNRKYGQTNRSLPPQKKTRIAFPALWYRARLFARLTGMVAATIWQVLKVPPVKTSSQQLCCTCGEVAEPSPLCGC